MLVLKAPSLLLNYTFSLTEEFLSERLYEYQNSI